MYALESLNYLYSTLHKSVPYYVIPAVEKSKLEDDSRVLFLTFVLHAA